MSIRLISLIAVLAAAQPALAQETGDGIEFRLGVGPKIAPEYFGSDGDRTSVTGTFELERLQFGGYSIGGSKKNGLKFEGSFGYVRERDSSDYSELEGLDDIDASFELGGAVRYRQPAYDVFAKLRYGVTGHESLVGELGADVIYRPTDQITLRAGPRILWGSDDYADTFFGVSEEESAASAFDSFEASSGILRQGVRAEAAYQFNDDWGVVGSIQYDQLNDDAADSPITQTEDQVSGSLVVTRKVTFGF